MTEKTGMRRSESGNHGISGVINGNPGDPGTGGETWNSAVTGAICRNSGNTDGESGNAGVAGGECRILGITGGVGAGKSTVLSYLKSHYGAYLLEADRIGHQVQQPGEPCYDEIVAVFGKGILNEDETIDRGRLGTIVYADRAKMTRLNQIVHPAVKERIRSEIDRICRENAENHDEKAGIQKDFPAPGKARKEICSHCERTQNTDISESIVLIVIEAALLLEDHYDEICDEVWYIYADEQTREERLRLSRGYSREKVRQIFSNQMSEEEFRRRCPVVIDNSVGNLKDTYSQIDQALGIYAGARQNGCQKDVHL